MTDTNEVEFYSRLKANRDQEGWASLAVPAIPDAPDPVLASYYGGDKNVLLNPREIVNQPYNASGDVFLGDWGTLSDGDYGPDGWYRYSATHKAQKVEAGSIVNMFYTLSWDGDGIGTLQDGGSNTVTGASPIKVELDPADGEIIAIVPHGSSNMQCERGEYKTSLEVRNIQHELYLCEGYYRILKAGTVKAMALVQRYGSNSSNGYILNTPDYFFNRPMRGVPADVAGPWLTLDFVGVSTQSNSYQTPGSAPIEVYAAITAEKLTFSFSSFNSAIPNDTYYGELVYLYDMILNARL